MGGCPCRFAGPSAAKPCLSEGGEDPLGVELLAVGGKHLSREI